MADLIVLCYHAVSPTWPAELSVSPEALHAQLSTLLRRGYRGTTFSQAVLHPSRERLLSVTFDDAYASVLTRAFPILDSLGLPGTVFAPTSYIGSAEPMSWKESAIGAHAIPDELLPLSWEGLRELQAHGWEVGSHTRAHPRLTQLDD